MRVRSNFKYPLLFAKIAGFGISKDYNTQV